VAHKICSESKQRSRFGYELDKANDAPEGVSFEVTQHGIHRFINGAHHDERSGDRGGRAARGTIICLAFGGAPRVSGTGHDGGWWWWGRGLLLMGSVRVMTKMCDITKFCNLILFDSLRLSSTLFDSLPF
jgi:hypothetical protein